MFLKVVIFALLLSSVSSAIISCDKCQAFLQDIASDLGDQAKTATLHQLDDAVQKACNAEFGELEGAICKTELKSYEPQLLQGLQAGQSPQQMCTEGQFC
uniref:Saposin B-type domain-containing protein n=1 Tax=Panagrellus redivivus TaxID=6233 RepID=A0A7E4VSD0_PANRE